MTAPTHSLSAVPARRTAVARVITELTAPAVLAVAGLLVVAVHSAGSGAGAAWGGFAAVLVAGFPLAYVVRGVKSGKWSDHHIAERSQRAVPLLIASVSVAAAGLLAAVCAPQDLVALVLAQLVGLLAVLTITRWWKISIHTAVAGGFLGILVVLLGPLGTARAARTRRRRLVPHRPGRPHLASGGRRRGTGGAHRRHALPPLPLTPSATLTVASARTPPCWSTRGRLLHPAGCSLSDSIMVDRSK